MSTGRKWSWQSEHFFNIYSQQDGVYVCAYFFRSFELNKHDSLKKEEKWLKKAKKKIVRVAIHIASKTSVSERESAVCMVFFLIDFSLLHYYRRLYPTLQAP